MAGGEVRLTNTRADLIEALLLKMEEAGVGVERLNDGVVIRRNGARLIAVNVETGVYPGFPTDLQAQFMALMTLAEGESVIRETIFENRFMHAPELARLGAGLGLQPGLGPLLPSGLHMRRHPGGEMPVHVGQEVQPRDLVVAGFRKHPVPADGAIVRRAVIDLRRACVFQVAAAVHS
eukprot:gene48662-66056_t